MKNYKLKIKEHIKKLSFHLHKVEEALAETMNASNYLEEDNIDEAKIVDILLADKSTVDEYEEYGKELGFRKATAEETT